MKNALKAIREQRMFVVKVFNTFKEFKMSVRNRSIRKTLDDAAELVLTAIFVSSKGCFVLAPKGKNVYDFRTTDKDLCQEEKKLK